MNRKPVFDAIRRIVGRPFTQDEVDALDDAFDATEGSLTATPAPPAPAAATPQATPHTEPAKQWHLGAPGAKLIKSWEGCEKRRADGSFAAYPDPGSSDGNPWTIGWGSTGADVIKGLSWSQQQCDDRFDRDMMTYVNQVARAIGAAPTTPNQFDALVSFHYNTGAIFSASLVTLHKQGKYAEAQAQFGKWIYNNHKPMKGLINRRAAEATLYGAR